MSTPPLALPLTPQQRGVYFLHCLAPDSAVYNVPVVLRVRGPLDPLRLQRAVDLLRLRHDALRLTVEEHDGGVRQLVHTAEDAAPVRVRVTARPGADPREAAMVAVRHAAEPFDLVRGPLWRVDLVSTAPEDHALVFCFHHIVVDEISATTLAGELHRAYEDPALLDPAGPEHSYARFCAERPAAPDAGGLAFWRRRLAGLLPLPLPEEHVPEEHGLFTGDRVPFTVPARVADRLTEVCRTHRVSEFMVFHAVLQVLLHRWTGSEDIAVGTPMSGRTDERFLDTVGFFQNTVVLRQQVTPGQDFAALLKAGRRTVLEALQHQETPFEAVVDALRPAREGSRNPLFQVALVFNRRKVEQDWTLPGLTVEPLPFPWKSSHFDLTLTLQHDRDEITGSFAYSAQRLTRPTAARLASMYLRLLEGLLDDPQLTCGDAELQTSEERARVLALGRAAGRHVLDERLRPLPQGCYGQVWTGDPETGEVTPTGERARFDADGRLRPWRDPAEAALAAQPGVARALVAEEAGERVGYAVPAPGTGLPAARELLARLQQRVAAHLVPQRVVLCAELPPAPDGRVDPATVTAPAGTGDAQDPGDEKPRGATERCVAALFEELLGVPGLGRHDDFFDYGGHSLLAVRLAGRIGEETGRELPVSVLMKTPTVRGVAAALDAAHRGGPGVVVQLRDGAPASAPDAAHPVTVVLLHPVGGTLLCYDELLARLPAAVPVVGLERAAGPHPEDTTYDALVDRYATALAAALPGRRIALVGWSLGGVLAHSVAARLTGLGHDVALLALVDSLAGRTPDDAERLALGRDLLDELAARVEEFGSDVVGADDTELLLVRRLGVDPAALRRTPPGQAAAMLRGWGELLGLAAGCRPVPVTVPTRLYLCRDNPPGYPDELAASWRGLTGPTGRIPVPGAHVEALDAPAATVIAADLTAALAAAEAGRAGAVAAS
ncbi:alpha/beta fold hydrolase [Streptomyces sp. NPDC008150]|uniref:alpha/beta fold hydrolase n=1 Tax=Streptomyces sp. NPDC008150 TaxID=3364816 RepID=UPI0036EE06BB